MGSFQTLFQNPGQLLLPLKEFLKKRNNKSPLLTDHKLSDETIAFEKNCEELKEKLEIIGNENALLFNFLVSNFNSALINEQIFTCLHDHFPASASFVKIEGISEFTHSFNKTLVVFSENKLILKSHIFLAQVF